MSKQDDLIKFIDDPETIKNAVEGSMDKRAKVLTDSRELRQLLIEFDCRGEMSDEEHLKAFQKIEAYTANKQKELFDKIYELSPTAQFKDWKAEDAVAFFVRLKELERKQLKNKKESL